MAFMRTFWRSALLVLLLSTFGAAQQTISSTRDPQAVALVQAAVNAMGGPNAAQGIRTVVASGGTDTAFHSFLWKDDFSGGRHEFRRELTDGTNTRLLVSGHGTPAAAFDNKARKLRKHVAYAIWPLHLPIVMLYDVLQNTNYSLTLGPQAVIGNHTCFQLLAKDESGPVEAALSVQQWYIDATTGIPVRLSGNKCVFCGKETTREPGPDQSNVDHSIPRSRGGDNTIDNAQNTCRTCNLDKGTQTTEEYTQPDPGAIRRDQQQQQQFQQQQQQQPEKSQ